MPQSLLELIAEARGHLRRASPEPSHPPRELSLDDLLAEARANLARSVESGSSIFPRFRPQEPSELTVTRVIDGDTIEVDGVGTVRLARLNTPETVHPTKPVERLGPEMSQLASLMLLGKKVKIYPQAGDERDVYGRLMADVELPDGRIASAELGDALGRFPTTVGAPTRDYKAAAGAALSAGILRGLIYPIGALVPELYDRLSEEIDSAKRDMHAFMQQPQVFERMGRPSDTIQGILAGAPNVAGELIGGLAPGIGYYRAGQTVFRVAKAATMGARTVRTLATATATGAAFGIGARLEDGESRFSRVARDAIVAGAFETVALPFVRRAWKEEFGRHADRAVRELALRGGYSIGEAERKITAVRAGALTGDFESAQEVANLAKVVPELRGSPTHVQATRALELLDRILPEEAVVTDPALPPEVSLSFDLEVAGSRMPLRLPSRKVATEQEFLDDLDGITKSIIRERAVGRDVKIRNPIARDVRTWEFFKNRLLGRGVRPPATGRPLGSAPPGSVAETGAKLEVGQPVTVVQESGQRVRASIVEVGEPDAPADLVSFPTKMPGTAGRLAAAGLTGEEIRSLPELDLHVAATLATPGKTARQGRVVRSIRERLRQGSSLSAPADLERYIHFTPREAAAEGLDFSDYVTALTQHVLNGGELSPYQQRSFPYLAQLSRRVATLIEPQDVPVELGPAAVRRARPTLPIAREGAEIYAPEAVPRRTIPEEGVIFREEGGPTRETTIRAAQEARKIRRAALEDDATRLEADIERTVDPARKAALTRSLETVRTELKTVSERSELPALGRVKRVPPAHVVVKGPDGKDELRHVSQVFVDVPVVPGARLPARTLVPHPDGGDRHGLIHLTDRTVSLEPIGGNAAPAESTYFRSSLFASVDPEKDWGRDIPLFIHADGSVTLSVTPVKELITERQASFGHRFEFGPQDVVEARRAREPGGIRRTAAETLGLVEPPPPEFGRFPAGYQPRAVRGPIEVETRFRPTGVRRGAAPGEAPEKGFYLKEGGPLVRYGEDFEEAFIEAGEAAPEVRVRGGRRARAPQNLFSYGELRGMRIRTDFPIERAPSEGPLEYGLTRADLTGPEAHPEWATVRQAARILLKEGYSGEIPLRVRIAREAHRGIPDSPVTVTVREAAELRLPLPSSDRLTEEALARGIKTLPRGKGSELVFPDGSKRIFEDDLEALEAVMRVPISRVDRELTDELARTMNMGTGNGVDPEVDAAAFRPAPLQDILVRQIVKGGRPLAVVRTGDIDAFNSAFEVLTTGLPKGRRLQVQSLEFGPKGEPITKGPARLAVFDPDLVRARATSASDDLLHLGIDPAADPRLVVNSLDQLPHGLHIMESSDPQSAIMYTWHRSKSMKGNWERATVAVDETGPHRIYREEDKRVFTFRIC